MKPAIVLLIVFVVALGAMWLIGHELNVVLAGCIAMSAMLLMTGAAHFPMAKGMSMMLPPFVPFKTFFVYFTGIAELAAAVGLLLPQFRTLTGICLIVFFILILPANIYAAMHHINYQKGTLDGDGPRYLWLRVPLQLVFIAWVWLFAIYL